MVRSKKESPEKIHLSNPKEITLIDTWIPYGSPGIHLLSQTAGFFCGFPALTISAANSSSKALLAVSACSIVEVGGSLPRCRLAQKAPIKNNVKKKQSCFCELWFCVFLSIFPMSKDVFLDTRSRVDGEWFFLRPRVHNWWFSIYSWWATPTLRENMLINVKTNGGPEDLQTILYTMGLWKTYMFRSFYCVNNLGFRWPKTCIFSWCWGLIVVVLEIHFDFPK